MAKSCVKADAMCFEAVACATYILIASGHRMTALSFGQRHSTQLQPVIMLDFSNEKSPDRGFTALVGGFVPPPPAFVGLHAFGT
jgi:hypothetical protein